MSHIYAIFHPMAAGGRDARFGPDIQARLARLAREVGHELKWVATQAPGHAVALAQTAAQDGCPLVVAVGGDGTVNEVINGLLSAGPPAGADPPALGVVPVGSGNDLAWGAGLPLDPPPSPAGALSTAARAASTSATCVRPAGASATSAMAAGPASTPRWRSRSSGSNGCAAF